MTPEYICDNLNIYLKDVLNIYPYGSKIYETNIEYSDDDFIIVYKKSLLPSGAFKDNAISSSNKKIQGSCYSKGGFIDAINNYQISALECIFLPEDKIIKNTMKFKINKFHENEFVKKIISTASASWHNAKMAHKNDNIEYVKKNIYHALRILDFGKQIKDNRKIINYSSMNNLKKEIYNDNCKLKIWHNLFIQMSNNLKITEIK